LLPFEPEHVFLLVAIGTAIAGRPRTELELSLDLERVYRNIRLLFALLAAWTGRRDAIVFKSGVEENRKRPMP
jgi:hypothetical protein